MDARALMSLCLCADIAAERGNRVKGAHCSQQDSVQRIAAMCRQHRPEQKPVDTLNELGILQYVPHLARQMGASQDQLQLQLQQQQQQQSTAQQQQSTANLAAGAAYLSYMSALNQVVQMSTQIYHDAASPPHHKYAAHQVALLYQSLNMLQGETKPIRRLIEARFDDIKAVTESSMPYLDPELSTWLQGITWLCRQEVTVCPAYVHRRLAPLLGLLSAA